MKLLPLGVLFLVSSCAWVDSTRRSLLGDDSAVANKQELVPRAQYDELLHKYEDVKQKYDHLKFQQEDPSAIVQKGTAPSQEVAPAPVIRPTEVVTTASSSPVETVDVFASIQNQSKESSVDYGNLGAKGVEEQINFYQQALELFNLNKPNEALKIFQKLSTSDVQAIRTRSKIKSGEIFMNGQEFDLALQVFEEVLQQDSSSGATLQALKGLVICTDKLNLKSKKEKYQSLLVDIFEVGA